MNKKIFSIFLILIFFLTTTSCKFFGIKAEEERMPSTGNMVETTSETAVVEIIDPLEERLNQLEIQYSAVLRNKIESVSNEKYRQEILDDDRAIEAINFFNNHGYIDLLLDRKIALQEFGIVKLYDILKNCDKETIVTKVRARNNFNLCGCG